MLQTLVLETCGVCETYQRPEFQFSETQDSDFTFPVARIDGASISDGAHGKFVPFMKVPGIALLAKRGKTSPYSRNVYQSVLCIWPVIAVCSLMAVLAGIIMWMLVRPNSLPIYVNFCLFFTC